MQNNCLAYILLIVFLLIPSSPGAAPSPTVPLSVLVSIAPQKYLLERIAGSRLAVTVLVKPGADPHAYEPSPSQMRAASAARAWFTIGVPFEDVWLPRISGAAQDLTVISTIKGIQRLPAAGEARAGLEAFSAADKAEAPEADKGNNHEPDRHSGDDPHVWLSPVLVRQMLPGLAKSLARLMPEHAESFRANAAVLADELTALDQELAARFAAFPPEKRVFLSFHPSWRYFAYNYQLTELAIEVNGKEPGPKRLSAIVKEAERFGVRTVFVEPQFPKHVAEVVAAAIKASVVEVDPLAENLIALYTDLADKLIASFSQNE